MAKTWANHIEKLNWYERKDNPCNSMADEFGSLPPSCHMNPQRRISHREMDFTCIHLVFLLACLSLDFFTHCCCFIFVPLYDPGQPGTHSDPLASASFVLWQQAGFTMKLSAPSCLLFISSGRFRPEFSPTWVCCTGNAFYWTLWYSESRVGSQWNLQRLTGRGSSPWSKTGLN